MESRPSDSTWSRGCNLGWSRLLLLRLLFSHHALDPEKWLEFKLQETLGFSFDPASKLGLDVASCIHTRAPIGVGLEGRRKYVIWPFILMEKMSQHFTSLKPGDIVEVKGPVEKLRYSSNMKRKIGMVCGPPGMMKHISGDKANRSQGELTGLLKDYTEEMVYTF